MLARVRKAVTSAVDFGDVMALGGLASLFYGLRCWWPPAAWMVLGTLLIAASVVASLRGGGR